MTITRTQTEPEVEPPPPPRRRRRQREKYNRREAIAGLLFISPWIIGFTVFTVISMAWSLRLSFSQLRPGDQRGAPVGLANYQLLLEDPKVLTSLGNTFFYALLAVPLEMVIALALASLLATVRRGAGVFRTIFFLPKMTPVVATAAVFLLLLNGNTGAINQFLGLFGIPGPQWLIDPDWVKPAIVIMSLWTVAGSMVILLAALQNVPRELYEAAETDGASRIRPVLLDHRPADLADAVLPDHRQHHRRAAGLRPGVPAVLPRRHQQCAGRRAVLRGLPVPAGVPAVQLRPGGGHGLAAVRDHPRHHGDPAQGRQPHGPLRGRCADEPRCRADRGHPPGTRRPCPDPRRSSRRAAGAGSGRVRSSAGCC